MTLLLASPASAAVDCAYDQGADVLTVTGAGGDAGSVTVVAGDAIQVTDLNLSTAVACSGAGGPATVANTDFVNLTDAVAGASVVWLVENPERWTSGADETELLVAAGSGSDAFIVTDTNSTADSWAIGSSGLDWNNTADSDVGFLTQPDQVNLLGQDGDDIVTGSPIQLGGPFNGPARLEIEGGRNSDIVIGSSAGDRLEGNDGNDTVEGRGGADTLDGGSGTNTLSGGAGTDVAEYDSATTGIRADLNLATPQNTGFSTDTLNTIEGLDGGPKADTLIGDGGSNALDGGADDDVIDGRAGVDALTGGSGTDTATYASAPAGVTANLTTGTASGGAGADSLATFENLVGSPFGDGLTGDGQANAIAGGAGNDTVSALAGPDSVDVRDGGPDTAACGTELDSATADQASVDAVNADCETVSFLPEPDAGGDGGGGGGGGEVVDTELTFDLAGKAKQRVLKQKGVVVRATCPLEDCTATAGGTARRPLKPVTAPLAGGDSERIKLKLKRKQLRSIAAALKRGKKPKVKVNGSGTDAAGNEATDSLKVTAKR